MLFLVEPDSTFLQISDTKILTGLHTKKTKMAFSLNKETEEWLLLKVLENIQNTVQTVIASKPKSRPPIDSKICSYQSGR